MNKAFPIFIFAAASLSALTGCKTTEANYREAYETTVAHQRERNGGFDTPELQGDGSLSPREITVPGGVTLPLATAWLSNPAKGSEVAPLDSVERYNVVVARFRQVFNAGQMLRRLRAGGYPSALLLKTRDSYFVATSTTSVPDSALVGLNHVKADSSLVLKAPFPFILRPGHLAR